MNITSKREYPYKNPNLPGIRKWLDSKYIEESNKATNLIKLQEIKYRYTGIKDEDIWVEYNKNIKQLEDNTFLVCFSVIKKGYGVADAKLNITTFDQVVEYFKIPVIETNTYFELFDLLKNNFSNVLYKVKNGSGKYGIALDNNKTTADRYKSIISALNEVCFNIRVNYTGETITTENPHIGEIVIHWPGFMSTTLEVYPLEEIK